MKYIDKRQSPSEFEDWKDQENPTVWNDLPSSKINEDRKEEGIFYYSKEELRTVLVEDQGYICGYCQDLISNNRTSKIEHIKARGVYPDLIFDFTNLISCCKGEKINPPPKELHCDTFRDNADLLVTPLDTNCENHFRYDELGNIYHVTNEGLDTIKKLNLDTPKLNNRRQAVIDSWLSPEITITEDYLNELKEIMSQRDENHSFKPFCQVILNILS
jgi:uncharacterized protein (TIGR02646 family)